MFELPGAAAKISIAVQGRPIFSHQGWYLTLKSRGSDDVNLFLGTALLSGVRVRAVAVPVIAGAYDRNAADRTDRRSFGWSRTARYTGGG